MIIQVGPLLGGALGGLLYTFVFSSSRFNCVFFQMLTMICNFSGKAPLLHLLSTMAVKCDLLAKPGWVLQYTLKLENPTWVAFASSMFWKCRNVIQIYL